MSISTMRERGIVEPIRRYNRTVGREWSADVKEIVVIELAKLVDIVQEIKN